MTDNIAASGEQSPDRLPINGDHYIAYRQLNSKLNNGVRQAKTPGIIFLGGFKSDMTGTKAVALEAFCLKENLAFTRFDYMGHGASSGEFTDCTIGLWLENALAVIDRLTEGPQLLVGSSMGGWLALLAALARPSRVVGLIGLAAAPDFTETMIWEVMEKAQQEEVLRQGSTRIPSESCGHYIITRGLIEEARNHLLLKGKMEVAIHCPVMLVHGMKDADVPYQTSVELAEKLSSKMVEVTLLKESNHRLSEEADLQLICRKVKEMLSFLEESGAKS